MSDRISSTMSISSSPQHTFNSTGSAYGTSIDASPSYTATAPTPRRVSSSTTQGLSPTSRRTSSLIHEIQPPSRRLSAHQVLLLTPFGTAAPSLPDQPAPAMGREGTSVGGLSVRGSLSRLVRRPSQGQHASSYISPFSMGTPISSGMGREPSMGISAPPPPPTTLPPRSRHSSATLPVASSPLTSTPLTSIPSNSDKDPTSVEVSREPSEEEEEEDKPPAYSEMQLEMVAVSVGTVAMTRSNSLPVLTLRELEAMKEKDTELGIARGGDWAWVGTDEEGSIASEDIETPGLPESSVISSTPLDRSEFTFQDPFASGTGSTFRDGTFRRTEETARFGSYRPIATLDVEGYHYSPSSARRGSDIPLPSHNATAHRVSDASSSSSSRRPSAPALSPSDTNHTPRPGIVPMLESPRGSHIAAHPQRPKITRYKTSPARSQGLGLAIVVKPEDFGPAVGPQINAEAGGSLGRKGGRVNLSTVERRERRHAQLRDDNMDFGPRRGSWAPVDIVDGLEIGGLNSLIAALPNPSNRAGSTSSTSSRGSFAFPGGNGSIVSLSTSPGTGGIASARPNIVLIGAAPRAMSLTEVGSIAIRELRRNRVDSLDSALAYRKSSSTSASSPKFDLSKLETMFGRRASTSSVLATLRESPGGGSGVMGVWRLKQGDTEGGRRGSEDESRLGAVVKPKGDWYERRGSWAEGCKRD